MNRKQELFSDAMNELDSRYLEEALFPLSSTEGTARKRLKQTPYFFAKKTGWKRRSSITILAACFCLALAAAGMGVGLHEKLQPSKQHWPVKEPPYPFLSDSAENSPGKEPADELAEIPHWEDMELYEQYSEIQIDQTALSGITYSVHGTEVPPELIRDFIDTKEPTDNLKSSDSSEATGLSVIALGWDEYAAVAGEDGRRTCLATVYAIDKLSPECAIAVRYEGNDIYYAAVNSLYRPQTLGEFTDSLNLRETLVFSYALYEYQKSDGETATVCFEKLDGEQIWDVLSTCLEAENEYSDFDSFASEHEKLLDFSIDIPLLGYRNISISLWDNGYLETNILDTGKRFFIGEEALQKLLDYILNDCEGYEIIDFSGEEYFIPE